ncbi:MAG: LapA family protein [Acidithiobacillus sp.]|nr:LapA family protein [Acidithiobacillus sp.]
MWIIFSLFIAALAVIFSLQNNIQSSVHFFNWNFQQSIGIIVLIAFVAGIIASSIFYLPTHIRNHWKLRRHRKQIAELESSLAGEQGRRQFLEKQLAVIHDLQSTSHADQPAGEAPTEPADTRH